MPTIAITGASGHLGTALVHELLRSGKWDIRAQYHSQHPPIEDPSLTWLSGDLSEPSLHHLFEGASFVIHCAALISITGPQKGKVYAVNVKGTQHVLDVSSALKIKRLIHVSSTHALQELPGDTVFDETRPHKEAHHFAYDYTKACAEQLVLDAVQRGMDAVIVRPSSMIGPEDHKPSLLGAGLYAMAQRKIPALVKGGYDFVDVRDVARSIISCLEKGRMGESYNLTGKYYEIRELAHIVSALASVKPPRFIVPNTLILLGVPFLKVQSKWTKKPPKFTRESIEVLKNGHTNMSHEKAKRELGHDPRPIEVSIRDLLRWFDAHEKGG